MQKDSRPGFALVLHSHIPWVLGQGQWPHGAVWLFEAAAETYIPLLDALERVVADGIRPAVTIGITPALAEQLAHSDFPSGFSGYLQMKIDAATADRRQFNVDDKPHFAWLAENWITFYSGVRDSFRDRYHQDLVAAFSHLQDIGAIEIITSCAAHGYMPLIGSDNAARAQIRVGVESYRRHFGRDPVGFWLPECAYRPRYAWSSPIRPDAPPVERAGIEELLSEAGIRYFIIDAPLLRGGKPEGVYLARFEGLRKLWEQFESEAPNLPLRNDISPYRVYKVGGNLEQPVAVLTRDPRSSLQVWSGKHGYPGDGNYLEFHKKRFPGGHRYWKITHSDADIGDKEPYYPDDIEARLEENSDHMVNLIKDLLQSDDGNGAGKVLCAPYDTELYGHWWFEGPRWLEKLWRKLDKGPVRAVTGSEALERAGSIAGVSLPEGSWGEGGFHQIWYNRDTTWYWELVYEAEEIMVDRCRGFNPSKDEQAERLLESMGRELLLLEASDWPFVISTGTAPDYAELRIRSHHRDFMLLNGMFDKVRSGRELDAGETREWDRIRLHSNLFPEVKYNLWV